MVLKPKHICSCPHFFACGWSTWLSSYWPRYVTLHLSALHKRNGKVWVTLVWTIQKCDIFESYNGQAMKHTSPQSILTPKKKQKKEKRGWKNRSNDCTVCFSNRHRKPNSRVNWFSTWGLGPWGGRDITLRNSKMLMCENDVVVLKGILPK